MAGEARLIRSLLSEAQQQITNALAIDKREARLEARLLLQDVLGVSHAWLLAHEKDGLEDPAIAGFQSRLDRRLTGEPIAYIIGHREFFGLDLKVSRDTLIPRPDTETLVEAALQRIPQESSYKVLDLGTGTGAIALAIASQRPATEVIAVDLSQNALQVAIVNAEQLGIRNVEFIRSDWFSGLSGKTFDIIVTNPPYIAENDTHLSAGDLRFEPIGALASGKDGLDDIRKIIEKAMLHLEPGGKLLLEHGYDQAERLAELLKLAGFDEIGHVPDLAGILRVTYGIKA